jgi:hypothetical protein
MEPILLCICWGANCALFTPAAQLTLQKPAVSNTKPDGSDDPIVIGKEVSCRAMLGIATPSCVRADGA